MNHILLKSRAKINLGLDVLGTLPNGYHSVSMVMQSIDLYDDVRIERTDSSTIEVLTNLHYLPANEKNIAFKAALLLKNEFAIRDGLRILLKKRIPVAAGLAGGSANAAAVLKGMNKLFELGLTASQLRERGLRLGADVPFCIMQGTALAEGIGEKLTPLAAMPVCYVLLAKPSFSVSTPKIYQALDQQPLVYHPDIAGIISGLQQQDIKVICQHLGNTLETVTIPLHEEIGKLKQLMIEQGALGALMSGSGPTVFGLFDSAKQCQQVQKTIMQSGLAGQTFVTTTYNRNTDNS